jgi:hypothetical protein
VSTQSTDPGPCLLSTFKITQLFQEEEKRRTRELRSFKNFNKDQIFITRALNIMTVGFWEVAHITRTIVECSRRLRSFEKGGASLTPDEKGSLITAWMPVDLWHGSRMYSDNGSGEVAGNGEGQWINHFE